MAREGIQDKDYVAYYHTITKEVIDEKGHQEKVVAKAKEEMDGAIKVQKELKTKIEDLDTEIKYAKRRKDPENSPKALLKEKKEVEEKLKEANENVNRTQRTWEARKKEEEALGKLSTALMHMDAFCKDELCTLGSKIDPETGRPVTTKDGKEVKEATPARDRIDQILGKLALSMDTKSFETLVEQINGPIKSVGQSKVKLLHIMSKGPTMRNDIMDLAKAGCIRGNTLTFNTYVHGPVTVEKKDERTEIRKIKFDLALGHLIGRAQNIISDNFAGFNVKDYEKPEGFVYELSEESKKAINILKERANIGKKDEKELKIKPMHIDVEKAENTLRQKEMIEATLSQLLYLKTIIESTQKDTRLTSYTNSKNKTVKFDLDFDKAVQTMSSSIKALQSELAKTNVVLERMGISIASKDGVVSYGGLVQNAKIDLDTYNMHKGKEVFVFDKAGAEEYMDAFLRAENTKDGAEQAKLRAEVERIARENGLSEKDRRALEDKAVREEIPYESMSIAQKFLDSNYRYGIGDPVNVQDVYDYAKKVLGVTELPKNLGRAVDKILEEQSKGVQKYNQQQREKAEATKNDISIEAEQWVDRYYSNENGTAKSIETWLVEDKGLKELPKGLKLAQENRLKAMSEAQKQKAPTKEELSEKDIAERSQNPLKYASEQKKEVVTSEPVVTDLDLSQKTIISNALNFHPEVEGIGQFIIDRMPQGFEGVSAELIEKHAAQIKAELEKESDGRDF